MDGLPSHLGSLLVVVRSQCITGLGKNKTKQKTSLFGANSRLKRPRLELWHPGSCLQGNVFLTDPFMPWDYPGRKMLVFATSWYLFQAESWPVRSAKSREVVDQVRRMIVPIRSCYVPQVKYLPGWRVWFLTCRSFPPTLTVLETWSYCMFRCCKTLRSPTFVDCFLFEPFTV